MKNLLTLLLLTVVIVSLPNADLVSPVPGMANETIYSGYLDTVNTTRKIHYIFIAARQSKEKAPLTIWLNGGPGCSSLIGMLQQLGPYIVGNKYKKGDELTKNSYSWNNIANLLFLQSPAIVGFSSDTDRNISYNDSQTADDAFAALKYFLKVTAPQFNKTNLYLTGQSYAGKYIPDIAVRILRNNKQVRNDYINLKGLLIGNGVMNFAYNSLERSSIQYMIQHDFVDDRLFTIYRQSCLRDYHSPRCRYFQYQMRLDLANVDKYSVYEVCYKVKSTQAIRLIETSRKYSAMQENKRRELQFTDQFQLGQINQCFSDDGAKSYWNNWTKEYHVESFNKTWNPCSQIHYSIEPDGSLPQYEEIFLNNLTVWLYNGDWDDVVPLGDTQKNLQLLRRKKVSDYKQWFFEKHHAGFYQQYDKNITLITIKGASHMVPQTKPMQSYQMFCNFINGHPVNTPC